MAKEEHLSKEEKDLLDTKKKIANVYEKLQDKSIIKSNKNVIDLLRKDFEEKNKAEKTFAQLNGIEFKDKIDNKRKQEAKANLSDDKLISSFLEKIGLDENQLVMETTRRAREYNLYEFVVNNLPVLNQALDIMVDSILSPEMMDKESFIVEADSKNNDIRILVNNLIEHFELEEKAVNWIYTSLLKGDSFVEIINMETVSNEMEKYKELGTSLLQENVDYSKTKFKSINSKYKTRLDSIIKEEKLTESCSSDELMNLCEVVSDVDYTEVAAQKFILEEKRIRKSRRNKDKDKSEDLKRLESIYLKTHKPENILVLKVGDFILGYISIDTLNTDRTRESMGDFTAADSGITNRVTYNFRSKQDMVMPANEKVALAILQSTLEKLDKEKNGIGDFLKKNDEFKQLIFNLVASRKQVAIRFIPEEKMVHFKHRSDENNVYGISLFKSMMMFIKHYLAVLTANTIFNLTRAAEKRKIGVEISSLDMDAGGALNEVIRTLKKKEQSVINQINNVDNFTTELTAFDDIFVPLVDGQEPIKIESIPGQQNSLDPDYLETLKGIILNGIRVPKSLLNEVENSYRTSLAQENIMFAMQIISEQKIYTPIFNDMIEKLLHHVYGEAMQSVEITLNPPTTLMNETISNNINNVESIVRFIYEAYEPPQDTSGGMGGMGGFGGMDETRLDKSKLVKYFMKNIDWRAIDRMVESKKDQSNVDSLNKNKEDEEDMFGDMGGMGGMDMDMGTGDDMGGEE